MADNKLVVDVADALAHNQSLDWERSLQSASETQERPLRNLRSVAKLFQPLSGDGPESAVHGEQASPGTRLGLTLLLVVCAAQVVAALVALPGWQLWVFQGQPVFPRVAALLAFAGCALVLVVGGRRDYRARLLGVFFGLSATSFAWLFLPGWLEAVYPDAFMPLLLWLFVREFPRVHRLSWVDGIAGRMTPVATAVGSALFVANLPFGREPLAILGRSHSTGVYWIVIATLMIGALATLMLRWRLARGDEFRRVALFVVGLVVGSAPILLDIVVELLVPQALEFGSAHRGWITAVVFMGLLSIPFTLSYAVLAHQALELRLIIRATYERLLARRLLVAVALAPIGGLAWLLASQPDQPVGVLLDDWKTRALVILGAAGGGLLVFRRTILVRLDAWVCPEVADQRQLLAAANAQLVQTLTLDEVTTVVTRAAERVGRAPASLLVLGDLHTPNVHGFVPLSGDARRLARDSAILFVLESTRQPLLVDPEASNSAFELLPREAAAWTAQGNVTLIVPIVGPGTDILGLLALGRRADDRLPTQEDIDNLNTLAGAAGLALESVRLRNTGAENTDALPARECPTCHATVVEDDVTPCGCGVAYVDAPVPRLVGGKIRIERRLGAGGMGVAYLAQDIALGRHVVVKALPTTAVDGLVRLKQEARSMAAFSHPGIAQILSLETWRGRPLLVVEYLGGGTLQDRIEQGPLSVAESTAIATSVARALEGLHAADYLHCDIKPSNIAFGTDGSVKLLDFGLARLMAGRLRAEGGTVPYMSPEALGGAPAGPADDIWSLSVVYYQMLVGCHPFAAAGSVEVVAKIKAGDMASLPNALVEEVPLVKSFFGLALGPDLESRPQNSSDLVRRIKSCAGNVRMGGYRR